MRGGRKGPKIIKKSALRIATSGNSASLGLALVPDLGPSRRIADVPGRTVAVWMIEPRHLPAMASPDVVSIKACARY
jgi:hypothetical protein